MMDLDDPDQLELLNHYVERAASDRDAWHDRVMSGSDLSRRHGLLIAGGWLEQNSGHVSRLAAGEVTGCYRATSAGRAAVRRRAETS